jgi:hypothetical protein
MGRHHGHGGRGEWQVGPRKKGGSTKIDLNRGAGLRTQHDIKIVIEVTGKTAERVFWHWRREGNPDANGKAGKIVR